MTVPVGTLLTFQMSRFSVAAHTATTGPGDPLREPDSFLGRISASVRATRPFDQQGVYPSDARGDPAFLTPMLHGNGLWSTGFMDRSDATPQPKTFQVKIVAPGTYNSTSFCPPSLRSPSPPPEPALGGDRLRLALVGLAGAARPRLLAAQDQRRYERDQRCHDRPHVGVRERAGRALAAGRAVLDPVFEDHGERRDAERAADALEHVEHRRCTGHLVALERRVGSGHRRHHR